MDYYLEYLKGQEKFPRAGFNRAKKKFVEDNVRTVAAGAKVLDAGCGVGWVTEGLTSDYEVYGVDKEREAVERCQQHCQGTYVVADILGLPYPDEFFDIVVLTEVIEHLTVPEEVLREMHRLLKPRGLLLVTTPNYGSLLWRLIENIWYRFFVREPKLYLKRTHPSKFTLERLRRELETCFEVKEAKAIYFRVLLTAVAKKLV